MQSQEKKNLCRTSLIDGCSSGVVQKKMIRIIEVKCMICKLSFETMDYLEEHNEQKHQIKAYSCHVKSCQESFACKAELNDHVQKNHKAPFSCAHCPTHSEPFETNFKLCQHVLYLHQEGKFACTRCSVVNTTRESIKAHWDSSHVQKLFINKLFCIENGCKEEFPFEQNEASFWNHLFGEHGRVKKFKCLYRGCTASYDHL